LLGSWLNQLDGMAAGQGWLPLLERVYHACNALAFAERYSEALSRFDEAISDAR
jgi:uncharacterized protein YutD